MPKPVLTNTFSVCLLCNEATAELINQARTCLAVTPHRDDPPHITLLRGISSSQAMTDEALATQIKSLLEGFDPEVTLTVKRVISGPNLVYGSSSALTLMQTDMLRKWRKEFKRRLRQSNYRYENIERLFYLPHITLRLGVPASNSVKIKIYKLLPQNTEVVFDRFAIFRLQKDGQRNLMHIVPLGGRSK